MNTHPEFMNALNDAFCIGSGISAPQRGARTPLKHTVLALVLLVGGQLGLHDVRAGAAVGVTETAEMDKFLAFSLEELAAITVDKVYGASRYEQKTTEAPSSVSIITKDEIKKQGHRTLGDILRSVRGFYVTYDRAYNAIGVRGVNRPGDYGGRMLITIDGHRLNDPVYDTAASDTDFLLDVDLIERVEVIRGPGSSLYGNNAFFGVINIITRRGSDLDGAEVSGSVGSFDTYTGRVTFGSKFANGIELLLSGTLYDSAGNRNLYYPEFAAINNGVAENLDGGWAKSVYARVSWKGLSLEGGYVDRQKTWPTAAYSTEDALVIFNDPRFVTTDERAFANLKFEHVFENAWEVKARAYYDRYRFDGQYPYDYFDPLQPVYLNVDVAQSQSVGAELQVTKTFFDQHRVTGGAEIRYDFQLDQQNFDLDPLATYLDSRETASFVSFYVQDEYRVLTNLILNAGLRYDHFSTFGDTVNPRAALIYAPWAATTFKALYGQAFRAPNAYENYYESVSNKRNPNLGPETIRSYELVWEQQWGKHWRTSASLFYNDIDGLIGYQEDPSDSLLFFDNLDSVVAKGGEFEVETHLASGLQGRASYTYTVAEEGATGERLSNSPEHLAKVSLSVPVWKEKVFASAEVQGMSRRLQTRGGKVGGFVVANATLYSRELLPGLEVSASIYNLFDQRFSQDSIEQNGRQFRLKATWKF
jgi:outer membrane receptor for ferrienterochelin and colicins